MTSRRRDQVAGNWTIRSSRRSIRDQRLLSLEHRLAAVRDAASFVSGEGYLWLQHCLQGRSRRRHAAGQWRPFGDGWISSEAKQTFQKGISREEIAWLFDAVGILPSECPLKLDSGVLAYGPNSVGS
jgi:hypothetical protein